MEVVYLVIGVSGSGKSTLGKQLAEKKSLPFFDADDFHPDENVEKMRSGVALEDSDREPWLIKLSEHINAWNKSSGAVLACSALKEKYRQQLAKGNIIKWIVLEGSLELIESRMQYREGHYMKPGMLNSQFESWESPVYGVKVDVQEDPDKLISDIEAGLDLSDFGVVGLGTMGGNITRNLLRHSVSTSVFNRIDKGETTVVTDFLVGENHKLLQGTTVLTDFVKSLHRPRKILIMIPAGSPTDDLLSKLIPILDKGDIIIDGGNVHYHNSISRAEKLKKYEINYLGAGISGGGYGALHGPSIMAGGNLATYAGVRPILEIIAAEDSSGRPSASLLGPQGSGHFVKMVHNGIEYAEMQLIAEVYAILKTSLDNQEISDLFSTWNKGETGSYLLGISSEILKFRDGSNFLIDMILDEASSKGTGSWTVTAGMELGVSTSLIHAAVEARYLSMMKSERIQISQESAGKNADISLSIDEIKRAYQAARIINHHQGFALLKAASVEFDWNLELSEIARIWTAGCILQSRFMEELKSKFEGSDSIFKEEDYIHLVRSSELLLNQLTAEASASGIALPCFTAALQYWLSINTKESTANLIQAQRDYFGAHGFRRRDDPENNLHNNNWKIDG